MKLYRESDGDLSLLDGKTIGIIGYGNQGRVHALNLRDSGSAVLVGLHPEARRRAQAIDDGFEVVTNREATERSSIIMICTPDGPMADIYAETIGPHLCAGQMLLFAHGFNVHFGALVPPENVDCGLVSPKGQALGVRDAFLRGKGLPALLAVQQDVTGEAWPRVLAYAAALGCLRAGGIETTFREETETDLFGEQAVLCGGIPELIKAGFNTLVEAGYSPEVAYFECLHETKLIVDLIVTRGLSGMREAISDTAEWGGYIAGDRVIGEDSRKAMRELLAEIQDGRFARQWIEESRRGRPELNLLEQAEASLSIEAIGQEMRKLV